MVDGVVACAREIISRRRRRMKGGLGIWVWVCAGKWVFGDCAAVTRVVKEQHLYMCMTRPCIRTALKTSDQPNSESENRLVRQLTTRYSQRSETKKKRMVSANFIVNVVIDSSTLPRERESVITDSARTSTA